MKKSLTIALTFILTVFFQNGLNAQIETPLPSPNAEVTQTVGLTEISISYSSPGVKGREGNIWGGLVPYGEIWRMGANASTKISFSEDVVIQGNEVEAGTYSMGAIPSEDEWTIILNSDLNIGGWGGHDPENDVLRFTVTPEESDFVERMRFSIVDFTNQKGTVRLDWENLAITFDVEVNTDEQAWESIQSTLNPEWITYARAANYALTEREDYETALDWIETSIEINEHWYNTWYKARILKAMGRNAEAIKTAHRAKELGLKAEAEEDANFFFKSAIEEALEDWN